MSNLRHLSPADWPVWRAIRLAALADSPDAFGSTWEREQGFTEAEWRSRLASPCVVIETDSGPVAGASVVELEPGVATVVAMWVHPAHRGHGHCRTMLDELVPWARERNDRIVLSVNRANPTAGAAYASYGFVRTGESHPLRPGSDQLCDVMELRPTGGGAESTLRRPVD